MTNSASNKPKFAEVNDVHAFLEFAGCKDDLLLKLHQLNDSGLSWYKEKAMEVLEVNQIRKQVDQSLIRNGLPKSNFDLGKKLRSSEYYVANVRMFLNELERIPLPQLISIIEGTEDSTAIKNYCGWVSNNTFDAVHVLNQACVYLKKKTQVLPRLGKRSQIDPFEMWQFAKQTVFGQVSAHAFADKLPEASVALIRQVFEIRLRRAFGIRGKCLITNPQQFEPIGLSVILDCVKAFESKMVLSLDCDCLSRVNQWSNYYLHGGSRELIFAWTPGVVLQALRIFCIGDAGDPYCGVKFSINVLDDLHSAIETTLNKKDLNNPKWQIVTAPAEANVEA